jgi:DNA-binding response OmpR family regulator
VSRVIVIDDDADLRAGLAERLRDAGFDVSEASDGATGMNLHRDHPADVVVTDIFMPGQEGIATVHQFRSVYPDMKIIAISGGITRYGKFNLLPAAKAIGADRCLRKPFKTAELVGAIRELLQTPGGQNVGPRQRDH